VRPIVTTIYIVHTAKYVGFTCWNAKLSFSFRIFFLPLKALGLFFNKRFLNQKFTCSDALYLYRFAHLVTPNYTGVRHVLPLALVLLLVASEAHAAGPVGPFEPSAPMGTADSDPGKCTQQKGLVYLSTYLSGYQLNEQGFDAPMGAVYYQGPKLTKSTTVPIRGEYCSSNVSLRRVCT
jgi:hypothetical protein